MAAPDTSKSEDISIVSPVMVVRRPSFAQVLQLAGSSQLLLSPTQGDTGVRITMPKDLFSRIFNEEDENTKERKQLYQGGGDLTVFAPAEQMKKATETMMAQFVSEMKGKNPKVTAPEVKDIGGVVREIEKTWGEWKDRPKKFEGARNLFMQFANKINDFKAVFDLIPSDNMYTSTLYGALAMLISASANYHAMAEGFATALDQITSELSNIRDLHALYDTNEMTTAVVNLYSHVMKFICASMKWCMDEGPIGRFLSSFQEGGYWSKVSDQFETIKVLCQRVKDIASKSEKVENRDQHIRAQEAERRATAERAMIWTAVQFLIAKQSEVDSVVKSKPANSPSSRISKGRSKIKQIAHGKQGPSGSGKNKIHTTDTETPLSPTSLFPTAQEIFSEYLEGIDVGRDLSKIKLWHSSLTKISLSPEPVRQIREWLTSVDPSMIWLRGYIVQRNIMNPISTLAANIVSAVQLARVPVLYYFCGLHICSGSSKTPTVTIMTSLVLQALEWREKFARNSIDQENDVVFTEERLAEAITFDNIWDLFVDIIRLLPKAPVIVIDLIDTYHNYASDIRELIDRLATLVPGLGTGEDEENESIIGADGLSRACKILVTSKTTCPVLDKSILKRVKVDVIDSPRWRGSRNSELQLGFSLREDVGKTESDHSLSEESDDSDGYATE
ncbi:hypothetical protein G7Y89_g7190 [Cudoniella acicularis]|uniref:DUF7708 domain-containing protein n=1 Tax=Cudoniella acicularis TaxID=354080 RepID=A0A8H4RKX3_9HELO|nr:hypothetical protein G7Y89_g7190 [Cudoniella acicularis]